jgi:hypothetical protein
MTMKFSIGGTEHGTRICDDKVVRRLDAFPELVQALRDGDVTTGRLLCARLFEGKEGSDSREAALAARHSYRPWTW